MRGKHVVLADNILPRFGVLFPYVELTLDRYRDSARSLRDPSQSVRAFREGVQALRDYGRAMNDRLSANREAREAREKAAREAKDWRE